MVAGSASTQVPASTKAPSGSQRAVGMHWLLLSSKNASKILYLPVQVSYQVHSCLKCCAVASKLAEVMLYISIERQGGRPCP